jgi:signal transduction histidine kinase
MSRLRFLAWYSIAWIPIAVLYSVMIYMQAEPRSLQGAIWGGTQSVVTAALLGLPAWWATRRLAERSRPFAMLAGTHVALGVAYALLWSVLILASIALFAPKTVYDEYLRFALGWQVLTGLFVYGMVAGIAHALTVGRRLQAEREASARAEALRARAELSALRSQMNPHFLFNTLHSISAVVRTDPGAAEEALEKLAGLLRRLLDVNRLGADHVALGDEWEVVRDQLALEQLRFGDRLQLETQVESDALDCAIPVFTLQPLVENAIKHGVAARTQRCTIRIAARVHGEMLEIEVADNGPGSDPRAALNANGLGIRAVRQRLLAQYGDRSGMRVETAPGQGFRIRVSLPAEAARPVTAGETRIAVQA